ncbi:acyltransferase family protein [Vibrio brasiliensis]|uniref:acyltransferase n=1 Tax=Vibrio brasiliensis TaxID=170652 RepID=UPI001EFCFE47|nr:acyltransferase family protein [Vibrio brasiliensis]MCG9751733.1 acyltransferase family protein [Vibrio brasiliensis]
MVSKKIQSIELGRVIAILAIAAMHCQMFLTYWQIDETPWFGYIFNQATRFAVPLFFLISGYLIQPKLVVKPGETLQRYVSPLLRVFIVWSVISLLMPFNLATVMESGYLAERQGYWGFLAQTPLNSLLEGGLVHLWFIPALICAAAIAALLAKLDKLALFIPIGAMLYLYGVLTGSYQAITELPTPFFTRNGPFFSTLLFAIGFMIRQRQLSITAKQALMLAGAGMVLHFFEAWQLTHVDQAFNANDYLFGTFIWGTGCFMWLLAKPEVGKGLWLTAQSRYVLPLYVAHLPMIIVMMNFSGMLALTGFAKDMLVLFGATVLTFLLVKGLEKTPLYRLLFR